MAEKQELPLIVGFVSDLMFVVKIEDAAKSLGFQVRWIEDIRELSPAGMDAPVPERQLGEHLVGPGAVLVDKLSRWQPSLLIFDLNNDRVPWQEWITMLTSAPATRRIPVLCFGSHVDIHASESARSAGATAVVARSRFASALPDLISKHARKLDRTALLTACSEPLTQLAIRGLQEFNRGEYFEAHETLEEAWMKDDSAGRDLYRAILQVAVAYLQIERGNYNGAVKMFLRMRQWLDPLPDRCRGVDVASLRLAARVAHQALLASGPEGITNFDKVLMKPVRYDS
jgi:predicted metal-dependent hydrolase